MLTASASFLLCSVERGSVADTCGLKVGDQILEVNGHDFHSILHAEAASILKAYPTLMITVKVCDVTMVTTLVLCICTVHLLCLFIHTVDLGQAAVLVCINNALLWVGRLVYREVWHSAASRGTTYLMSIFTLSIVL